jgi:plastocyanin
MSALRFRGLGTCLFTVSVLVLSVSNTAMAQENRAKEPVHQIIVPGEDRFTPFAMTIVVGQKVTWINKDTEAHTIVSDDAFNTAGHRGVNVVVKAGGKFSLTFTHPGVFPFFCRYHAMLDPENQPKAPGPKGGIQDKNGNFGTPMNGVITVLSAND